MKYELNSDEFQNVVRLRMRLEPELSGHTPGCVPFFQPIPDRNAPEIPALLAKLQRETRLRLENAPIVEKAIAGLPDLVHSLAAVDGAVVLTRDFTLKGFGAVIGQSQYDDDNEKVTEVLSVTLDENPQCWYRIKHSHERPLDSFGTRHRSAYRFCKEVPGAMAFVISQDGDIRLFAPQDGQVVLFNVTTEMDRVVNP